MLYSKTKGKTPELTVGLVSLARSTFDIPLAEQLTAKMRTLLQEKGFKLLGSDRFVSDLDDANQLSRELSANLPDLLLVFQVTFSDSTMAVHLAEKVDAPVLLWAVPEERTGGRLRLNSLCGINLAAHALARRGLPYDYVLADLDDADAFERVYPLAAAGHAKRLLRRSRIGRVGEHPAGFDSCQFNQEALQSRFGVEIVQIHLEQLFRMVKEIDAGSIDRLLHEVSKDLDGLDSLDQEGVRGTLATYLALRQISEDRQLDGLAIRCWPQFFTELGCAACGAMSMLSNEHIPCSCETDVNGTITQLILQRLSGESAFGSDLVSVDKGEDSAVLWHCGLAPLSMADPDVRPRGTIHSNRQLPLLMEFPLKPGNVTLARLSESKGEYRLVIGNGQILQAPLSFSGTSGVIRFDRPISEVFDTIMKEGLEHHISLTYGDHTASLSALAKMLDLPVVNL